MSEDFDKEAERERLREKYDSKSGDREVTERMSQLLLQGATMTNKHCDTCGSPIFRYQGQEFCPTCQAEAQEAAAKTQEAGAQTQEAAAEAQEAGTQAGGEESESTPRQGQQAAQTQPYKTGPGAGAESSGVQDTEERPDRGTVGSASTGTAELGGGSRGASNAAAASGGGTPVQESAGSQSAGSGQLTAVGQSLAETIVTLSDRARETDDPHRSKALLEAAREAAETLAVLQGE